jgi:glycosyltransferase involved in cell wall biosynthesis
MRVLVLAQFYPPIAGGEERHVRNLSAGLVARGHDVTVATLWYPGSLASETDGGVKVCRLRGTMQRSTGLFRESERRHAPPFPDPELLYGLRQIVLREKPDVVHAHNWMFHSYLPLKRLYAAPLAITLHDFSHVCAKKIAMYDGKVCGGPALAKCLGCAKQHYGALKGAVTAASNWISGAAARRLADVFIAVSNAVAEGNRLKELGVPFEVIPNFVPDGITALSPEPEDVVRLLPENGFILFVGDLDYKKGISVLLEAYAALKNAPPLVLIGRRCATMPSAVPPGVSVFHDWPHSAIMHAWSRCLFGVLPSICADACPTVIMEAMASGKPVAATAIGGIPDLVVHAKTGLLVPPADAPSLAAALQTLSGDAQLREKMSTAALRKVETLKAGWVVPRIERLYARLLSAQALQQTLSRASA